MFFSPPPLRFLEFVATLSFNWIQFVGQGKATCAMRDRGLTIPPGLFWSSWAWGGGGLALHKSESINTIVVKLGG